MQHPDPHLACRRLTVRTTPDGRPQVIYRSNALNPRAVWGQPVPAFSGDAAFENFIVPLSIYGGVLTAAAHTYPPDTPAERIAHNISPHDHAQVAHDHYKAFGGASTQEALRRARDNIIERMYTRQRDRDPSTLTPDAVRYRALKTTASRMCVSEDLVRKVLTERGIPVLRAVENTAQRAKGDTTPHKFSKAYEHELKWKTLETSVEECRTDANRRGIGHKFVLADLHDEYAPGGYPTHCPATGEEFDWVLRKSFHSPRIARYDRNKPFISGNIVIVSKIGRKLIEGMTVVELPAILKTLPEIKDHYEAWREKHPTASPMPTPVPRRRRGAETD
jgi:hypothetical protein